MNQLKYIRLLVAIIGVFSLLAFYQNCTESLPQDINTSSSLLGTPTPPPSSMVRTGSCYGTTGLCVDYPANGNTNLAYVYGGGANIRSCAAPAIDVNTGAPVANPCDITVPDISGCSGGWRRLDNYDCDPTRNSTYDSNRDVWTLSNLQNLGNFFAYVSFKTESGIIRSFQYEPTKICHPSDPTFCYTYDTYNRLLTIHGTDENLRAAACTPAQQSACEASVNVNVDTTCWGGYRRQGIYSSNCDPRGYEVLRDGTKWTVANFGCSNGNVGTSLIVNYKKMLNGSPIVLKIPYNPLVVARNCW